MLDVKSHKHMLECLGEEETARLAGRRLIMDPGEKILVQHIEQEEGCEGKAVDDGRDDGVAERDDNQQRRCREESSPVSRTGRVLNIVYRARGRAEQSDFDVVQSQRHGLKEAAKSSRESLKNDETRSWNKYAHKTNLSNTHVRKKVDDFGRF